MQGARKISVIFYVANLINLKFQASNAVVQCACAYACVCHFLNAV